MSGGELVNIGRIAEKISDDLFSFFKWEIVGPSNLNYLCVQKEIHAKGKSGDHHHPTDVVFRYFDPYANKTVYMHTDLKSYAKGSIGTTEIRKALVSLAKSIDCAYISPDWRDRYLLIRGEKKIISGMLFVFNHDDQYDRDFYDHFKGLKSDNLHVKEGQQLHIVEPALINYIATLRQDINSLVANGTFPRRKYTFLYPEMTLHKAAGDYWARPATMEMIASPYLIIHHGEVHDLDDDGHKVKTFGEGYVIYYRRSGASEYEFMYLFDALSRFQILNGDKEKKIRIRIICKDSSDKLISNYRSAIANYVREWNEDEHRRNILERIDLQVVTMAVHNYKAEHIGWDRP
jgi:hypothetical protein